VSDLKIEHRPPGELKPYAGNARTHSAKQIAQIAASIKAFGFNSPILIDREGGIVAGHGRVAAAKQLGTATVPVIRLEHLSDAQKRAYILADNKLAEKAGWDSEILAIELQHFMALELDFDVSLTGFELPEIDVLIDALNPAPAKADPADAIPEITGPAVTRLGDIWQIGPHRLICGDATEGVTYQHLLAGEMAQMVFTDPPYNGRSPATSRGSAPPRIASSLWRRAR
jgi:ParB-like chromosome segregation protein Spo0J